MLALPMVSEEERIQLAITALKGGTIGHLQKVAFIYNMPQINSPSQILWQTLRKAGSAGCITSQCPRGGFNQALYYYHGSLELVNGCQSFCSLSPEIFSRSKVITVHLERISTNTFWSDI